MAHPTHKDAKKKQKDVSFHDDIARLTNVLGSIEGLEHRLHDICNKQDITNLNIGYEIGRIKEELSWQHDELRAIEDSIYTKDNYIND